MKIAKSVSWRSLAIGLVLTLFASGSLAGVEFSADTVQHGPKGQKSAGKMYVGDKRVRTEMEHQGQKVIQIIDEQRGVQWMLFPEQKKYMERKLASQGTQASDAKPNPAEDPCAGIPGLTCKKLGEEEIGGREAVKWEMVASHQGQTMKSTQWIDKNRGVPLRQERPNGQTTELKLVGNEDLNGRQVEKWETIATAPNQPETRTFEWYDPELGLATRQELPGGIVSELTNIRVGEQPDELFNVPAGYERMSPTPKEAPSGAQGGADQN